MRNSLLFCVLLFCGCLGEMDPQPGRGRAPLTLPAGTVSVAAPAQRPEFNLALVQRGQQRYRIYCAACHGPLGDGRGEVVRRGFPQPPSFHEVRLREADDGHFYSAIRNGAGRMWPYADRLGERDRWAVVAYVRALQLSRRAKLSDLPGEVRRQAERRLP